MALQIDLAGRPCLVVGGGGGGIGTAMAEAAAEAGAVVGIISNLADHADASLELLRGRGVRAASAVTDVTDESALVDAIATLAGELGRFRHAVNVVGGNAADDYQRAAAFDMDAFDRVVARNLRYVVVASREVAGPLLAAGEHGSIVNISSGAARGAPLLGAYAAAKAGLEAYTRTAALEWAPAGIRVNAVAPGMVRTPRQGMTDDEKTAARIPLRRRGDGRDIADAAMFLLSDQAGYVTGQTLHVDGGVGLGSPGGEQISNLSTRADVRERFPDA
jgi:NAD(P)-dependent dehydrogenase (short-subunit alcohol dehydrogenase family)